MSVKPPDEVLARLVELHHFTHGQEGASARLLLETAANDLAIGVRTILQFVGNANPIVLDAKAFAPLQETLDRYVEAGDDLVDDVLGWPT